MARLPRFVIPGHPQHVIVKGNNREAIFYENEDDTFYLNKLKEACTKHDYRSSLTPDVLFSFLVE